MTGQEQLEWREVLDDAFDWNSFGDLLLGLNDKINNYTGRDATIPNVILRTVQRYADRGTQHRLLTAALVARPEKPEIVKLARKYGATSAPDDRQLETILKDSNSMLDFPNWLERAARIQHAVCRIEIPLADGRTAFGTGFLVASDLVLTNHHVVEPIIPAESDPQYHGPRASASGVTCRFDYRKMSGGAVSAGNIYRLAPQWSVLLSPNNRRGQEPGEDTLDCALIRLAKQAGKLAVGDFPEQGGTERGWLTLPGVERMNFLKDHPLFIVQHPQAEPVKLAIETCSILDVNASRTRLRHRTNTDHGSSGSPCFDENWNLVALHHSGDPNFAFEYNEGVPIEQVCRAMEAAGIQA
jgi:V8-like Glu-specific endopeptidase